MSLSKCKLLNIPEFIDQRGALAFVEGGITIPFEIKRIYYLHNLNITKKRGFHAHKKLKQVIIALSGGFEIYLHDGKNYKTFLLESANTGLFICPMIWREIKSLSSKSICLVIASEKYQDSDYIRNFSEFLNLSSKNENPIP